MRLVWGRESTYSTADYGEAARRNSAVEGGAQNLVSLDAGDPLRQGGALTQKQLDVGECSFTVLVRDTTPGSQERSSDATGMTLVPTPGIPYCHSPPGDKARAYH